MQNQFFFCKIQKTTPALGVNPVRRNEFVDHTSVVRVGFEPTPHSTERRCVHLTTTQFVQSKSLFLFS